MDGSSPSFNRYPLGASSATPYSSLEYCSEVAARCAIFSSVSLRPDSGAGLFFPEARCPREDSFAFLLPPVPRWGAVEQPMTHDTAYSSIAQVTATNAESALTDLTSSGS